MYNILEKGIYCFIKNKLIKLGWTLVSKIKNTTHYPNFWDL